jgi:SepF-like predicted cell division protein (DUF552 family)
MRVNEVSLSRTNETIENKAVYIEIIIINKILQRGNIPQEMKAGYVIQMHITNPILKFLSNLIASRYYRVLTMVYNTQRYQVFG